MKYIRTKDGKIFEWLDSRVEWNEEIFDNEIRWYIGEDEQSDNYYLVENQIEKVADTIEELCDEFVRVSKSVHDFLVSDDIPTKKFNDTEIYGAVWCEFGLKYVARMNSEGKLELI